MFLNQPIGPAYIVTVYAKGKWPRGRTFKPYSSTLGYLPLVEPSDNDINLAKEWATERLLKAFKSYDKFEPNKITMQKVTLDDEGIVQWEPFAKENKEYRL